MYVVFLILGLEGISVISMPSRFGKERRLYLMAKAKTSRTRNPGYTKANMEAVSDNPEWTKEDFARAKPFSEVFPELHADIKRSPGRPKVDHPKAVALRLPPDVVEKFKAAAGDEWRARMAKTLKRAKV